MALDEFIGVTSKVGAEDIAFGTGIDSDVFDTVLPNGNICQKTKIPSLHSNSMSIIKGVYTLGLSDEIADHSATSGADWEAYNLARLKFIIGAGYRTIHAPSGTMNLCGNTLSIPRNIEFTHDIGFSVVNGTIEVDGPRLNTSLYNIESLRTHPAVYHGQRATISCHTNPNTGGGGEFYWNSTCLLPDDNGGIVKCLGVDIGRWIRLQNGFFNVRDYGACHEGNADDSAAVNACYTAAGQNAIVYFPRGTYLLNNLNPITNHGVFTSGDGEGATVILYNPSVAGICFQVGTGSATVVQGGISGVKFYTNNTNNTKTAICISDADIYTIHDVQISGSTEAYGSSFWGGAGSIGIRTKGRDQHSISKVTCFADRPIVISKNPNNGISADHYHFSDLYLGANNNPNIEIEDGANITSLTFSGYQAWVLGTHGLYWRDTTTTTAALNISFSNVRTEQVTTSGHAFYIVHKTTVLSLSFRNCYIGDRAGFYLRGVTSVTLDTVFYAAQGQAFDADASVGAIDLRNCFWQAGSTATIVGHDTVFATPKNPSTGALPPNAVYMLSSNTTKSFISDNMFGGTNFTLESGSDIQIGQAGTTGFIFISTSSGLNAIYSYQSATPAMIEVSDTSGFFSPNKNTSGSINLYWDSQTSTYRLQNNIGSDNNFVLFKIGSYSIP